MVTKKVLNKKINLSLLERIQRVIHSFSLTEKIIFWVFVAVLAVTVLSMLFRVNTQFLVEIPQYGGEMREGVIGSPRFVNPVLALSDTDKDLSALIYSGLMRIDQEGNLIPDLADSYEISDDGLKYHFKIKNDAVFHDGTPVSADDVIYTISMIMDPVVKSPLRGNWEGITVEKVSNTEINFHLPEPYSPFLYNTTLGILPKDIWSNVTPEEFAFNVHNTDPIGSGPYKVHAIRRNQSGVIESYTLRAFSDFALGRPFIKEINISIFKNNDELVEALLDKRVTSGHTINPEQATLLAEEGISIVSIPLPRIFGIFFNQNKAPALSFKSMRQALDTAIDKQSVVDMVLLGYGSVAQSIIPESLVPFETLSNGETEKTAGNLTQAEEILTNVGWEKNEDGIFSVETDDGDYYAGFSLATNNVPELVATGEAIVAQWKKLGIDVELKVFETNDIANSVIRPREFDALLFGEIIGRDLDLYAFWHSSQRNDPGLNIAGYTNIQTDNLLEEAREESDFDKRIELYRDIESEIQDDIPVSLLYSPEFIYALDDKVSAVLPHTVTTPSERFTSVYTWYIDTETVWKIFDK